MAEKTKGNESGQKRPCASKLLHKLKFLRSIQTWAEADDVQEEKRDEADASDAAMKRPYGAMKRPPGQFQYEKATSCST